MVCPFASLIGVGAVATGSQRLLVRDVRYRVYAWLATALLGGGWLAYFVALRRPEVRIALEVASVLALVVGAVRVRSLVRSGEVAPLTAGALGTLLGSFAYAVRSPWVAGAKAFLLAMIAFQWLGRAHFSAPEYGAAVTVVLALIAVRLLRRPASARFGALERFGAETAATSCPLGFGCAAADRSSAPGATAGEPAAAGHASPHGASLAGGVNP